MISQNFCENFTKILSQHFWPWLYVSSTQPFSFIHLFALICVLLGVNNPQGAHYKLAKS